MSHSRAFWLSAVLLLALPLLVLVALGYSKTGQEGVVVATRYVLSLGGLVGSPEDGEILKLRLLRALCAAGVGGTLALAGAMMQGLFRNPLAEPGLLGVSSGATLGAVLAIAILGGYGPDFWIQRSPGESGWLGSLFSLGLIPILAFSGAIVAALTIYRLATRSGRVSTGTLLLTGLAINSLLGAVVAGLQVLLLEDWQISRAIIGWLFGTLDDRSPFHLLVVWSGAGLALASIPFVGLELDLMSGGEEDAAALGVDPIWIKGLVLACVALATASAVSIAGQIAFVGLLVPHVARYFVGSRHRALLPVSFLIGAVLLVAVVVLQHSLSPLLVLYCEQQQWPGLARLFNRIVVLQPGVVTSLLGAPFFLYLLLRQSRSALN